MANRPRRNIERKDYTNTCFPRDSKVYVDYRDGRDGSLQRTSSVSRKLRKINANKNRKRSYQTMKENESICNKENAPPNTHQPQRKRRRTHKTGWYSKKKVNKQWKKQRDQKLREGRKEYTLYFRTVKDKIEEIENKELRNSDSMTFADYQHLKKYFVVLMFYNLLSNVGDGEFAYFINKMDVYNVIKKQYSIGKDSIIKYVNEFESDVDIERSKRGKHSKIECGLETAEEKVLFKQYIE